MIYFVLGMCGLVMVVAFIVMLVEWHDERPDECSRITFERFQHMYYMNPKAWELRPWTPRYDYVPDKRVVKEHCWFYFSFIESLKYNHFIRLNKDKIPEEVLKHFQRDIETYRDKYTEELKNKAKEIEDLRNSLNSDDEWKGKIKNIAASINEDIQRSKT